jgi:hypothetical protein
MRYVTLCISRLCVTYCKTLTLMVHEIRANCVVSAAGGVPHQQDGAAQPGLAGRGVYLPLRPHSQCQGRPHTILDLRGLYFGPKLPFLPLPPKLNFPLRGPRLCPVFSSSPHFAFIFSPFDFPLRRSAYFTLFLRYITLFTSITCSFKVPKFFLCYFFPPVRFLHQHRKWP